MLISFNNQYQNYPIVLVPDKIRNQLQFDVDENIIASELGISKPKKTQLRKPQPPSKYTYKEVSKVTIEYSNELVYLFFAFIISIYLGSSFEGEAFKATLIIFAGWTTFFLLFKFIFEDGVKIFKTSKIYIEKERDTKEFHELEIEYQQNLFQYNNKYNIIENEYIEQLKTYNAEIISSRQKIKKRIYQKVLNSDLPASRGSISLRRGYTELFFLNYIGEELKGLIFADMVPRIDWYEERNTYNPDFTLICNKTNLHIRLVL